jgi:hypothetical protein
MKIKEAVEEKKKPRTDYKFGFGNKAAVGHDGSNAGRKLKEVDVDLLASLASIQCTDEEIASVLDISVDTLVKRFYEILHKNRNIGKSSLRRTQWKMAQDGNPAAAIWLGKVYLKQKEEKDESERDLVLNINVNKIEK